MRKKGSFSRPRGFDINLNLMFISEKLGNYCCFLISSFIQLPVANDYDDDDFLYSLFLLFLLSAAAQLIISAYSIVRHIPCTGWKNEKQEHKAYYFLTN